MSSFQFWKLLALQMKTPIQSLGDSDQVSSAAIIVIVNELSA